MWSLETLRNFNPHTAVSPEQSRDQSETGGTMNKLNQSGQASAEFIFSLVISFGLFMLFLSIAFTFTVVEVGQYVAFSVARAQAGANKDPGSQRDAASNKYKDLQALPGFALLFKSGWFVFTKTPDIRQGSGNDFRKELGDGSSGPSPQFEQSYTGVSLAFQSKVMGIQIPFLNPANGDDTAFSTHLNAIVLREPSQAECIQYWQARGAALSQLPSGKSFYQQSSYVPMEDTGC